MTGVPDRDAKIPACSRLTMATEQRASSRAAAAASTGSKMSAAIPLSAFSVHCLSSGFINIPTNRYPCDDSCFMATDISSANLAGSCPQRSSPKPRFTPIRPSSGLTSGLGSRSAGSPDTSTLSPMSDRSSALRGPRTDTVRNSESIGAHRCSSPWPEPLLRPMNTGSSTPTPIAQLSPFLVSANPRLINGLHGALPTIVPPPTT